MSEATSTELPDIPNYTVLDTLATGGMARIYLAQRHGSRELCVLKLLRDDVGKEESARERFLREAHVATQLDHPGIARLDDAKWEKGLLYLAMEYIPGQDMESLMHDLMRKRKLLPPELSLAVSVRVLEALHYAHELVDAEGKRLDLVHRDLSPRNVMLGFAGEVKVIDFGLARGNVGSYRTKPGMVMGTYRYLSPEQALAVPVDRRSDIYSWGVVLWEALTGEPMIAYDERDILTRVVHDVAPLLSSMNARLPRALDAVLAKALAKEAEARFQTAAEFRAALIEAAPREVATPPATIAEFLVWTFPERHQETLRHLARARPEEDGPTEHTRVGDPSTETTGVGHTPGAEATDVVRVRLRPRDLAVPETTERARPVAATEPRPAPEPESTAPDVTYAPAPEEPTRPREIVREVVVHRLPPGQRRLHVAASLAFGLACGAVGWLFGRLPAAPPAPAAQVLEAPGERPRGLVPSESVAVERVAAEPAPPGVEIRALRTEPAAARVEERRRAGPSEAATKVEPRRTAPRERGETAETAGPSGQPGEAAAAAGAAPPGDGRRRALIGEIERLIAADQLEAAVERILSEAKANLQGEALSRVEAAALQARALPSPRQVRSALQRYLAEQP